MDVQEETSKQGDFNSALAAFNKIEKPTQNDVEALIDAYNKNPNKTNESAMNTLKDKYKGTELDWSNMKQ